MAQSYQDYIKSLQAGGSTSVTQSNPLGVFASPNKGTSTANSTAPVPPKTGTQIVQQATKGLVPQQTNVPIPQTNLPKTGSQIVQQNTQGLTPQQTNVPNQTNVPQDNPYFDGGLNMTPDQFTSTKQVQIPRFSQSESKGFAKESGLGGLKDTAYTGLTRSQAQAQAAADKEFYKGQTSANTSYTFNPQSISGFNKTFGEMRTKLDTIKNDAFSSTQQKKSDSDSILKSYTNQFAGLFSTPEEFQSAIQTSPEIQKNLEEYKRAGGTLADIASAIKGGLKVVGTRDNPDGTITNYLSDGTSETGRLTPNQDGTYSFNEISNTKNTQTLDQYLGRISTPAEKQAYESMLPEKKIVQDQISFEQSIPEKYKDLYFGTPERMGLIEQQRIQAEDRVKLLETQAAMEKENARAQTNLLIEKNNAELDAEEATVEENRLAARNYSTRMLAKLGALNTTGAAVEKLSNLEQRYQRQAQQLRTTYNLQNKAYEIKFNEAINDVEIKKADKILTTREDLSKSEADIMKEIFKLETEASRKSFTIIDKFAGEFRKQKEKYVKEAKAQAEKNAKAAAALSGNINLSGFSVSDFLSKGYQSGVPTPMLGAKTENPFSTTGSATLPGYLKALQGKNISDDLKAVIAGESKLSDYTPTDATKIQRELTKLGIKKADLPGGEKAADEVGKLSAADLTKGINAIYADGGSEEDIQKFKTDRKYQAFIMESIK